MFIISRLEKKQKAKKQKSIFKFIIIFFLILVLIILAATKILNNKSSKQSASSKNVTISSNKDSNNKTSTNKNNQLNSKRIIKENVNLDKYMFLGDSYTVLLKDTIEKNNPHAIVKAKTGVQPGYWNENFKKLPDNKDINGIILLIGVNGAAYSNNIKDTETLITSLVKKYDNKPIYVERVFPVGQIFQKADPVSFNKAITNHNKKISSYCNKYDNVAYIDTTKGLITNKGYLKYTSDGLHIASDKQKKFYKNIVTSVTKNEL